MYHSICGKEKLIRPSLSTITFFKFVQNGWFWCVNFEHFSCWYPQLSMHCGC